jgi:thermolabile hemolysin
VYQLPSPLPNPPRKGEEIGGKQLKALPGASLFVQARAALLLFPILCAVPAAASSFSDLIVFGDSLSDVGNVAQASFDIFPGPYYDNDRFTNGPVWVESLSVQLGLGTLERSTAGGDDFAYGGAKTTGTGGLEGFFIRDLDEQVTQFLDSRAVDPAALFVVFAGSNDFIQGQTDVNFPASRITTDINRLAAAGARDFLVPNLPLLGLTPRFNVSPATAAVYNQRTADFNAALDASLAALEIANADLILHRLDIAALFTEAIAMPQQFGLANVTDPAAPGLAPGDSSYDTGQIAPNANAYLFWDDLHPTATIHAILADRAAALVDGIPGDFNADATVDAEDLAGWQANYGLTATARRGQGDANEDGDVDGADFLLWQQNLSGARSGEFVVIPEPANMTLLAMAFAASVRAASMKRRLVGPTARFLFLSIGER